FGTGSTQLLFGVISPTITAPDDWPAVGRDFGRSSANADAMAITSQTVGSLGVSWAGNAFGDAPTGSEPAGRVAEANGNPSAALRAGSNQAPPGLGGASAGRRWGWGAPAASRGPEGPGNVRQALRAPPAP